VILESSKLYLYTYVFFSRNAYIYNIGFASMYRKLRLMGEVGMHSPLGISPVSARSKAV